MKKQSNSPYSLPNIRLFIAFRVFFNARFYYPVFTILFLDFGLTIEQFALLNTVWAITIVSAEVPSGVLADILGRKYLIVTTSVLMVMEMCLIAFVPLGNSAVIFWVFLFNRVLSGLAEAMASGADEAIAYDTLVANGTPDDWPRVLSLQMRLRSFASMITMTVGALLYDPQVVARLLALAGIETSISQQTTMRFPIYLTLVLAILATVVALKMEEERSTEQQENGFSIAGALQKTWRAGLWIGRTPFALGVILFGMCYDHILRMIVTMTSQYFRLIDLPEASFGLIGSAMGLLGLITPKIAERMAAANSPRTNMLWVLAIAMAGLVGLTGFVPYWGLIPMGCIFGAMMLVSFFVSHYLNRITESHQRATVLSFKGLAFNLAYGLIGFFFAALITTLRLKESSAHPDWSVTVVENRAFMEGIGWFPWYTLCCAGVLMIYCGYRLRKTDTYRKVPAQTSNTAP
ncbi:MFS transporter [Desulforhopalus singaporensis]|uniref:Predicted arabinose efflux permease, MFS family n=1 Tax=Desulforhopalus singaporensis TaxID=91360 RepID=A0A1H0Q6X9_9BACT|nr:MFS transporter [Desulforhopalus singaporensis]SDP13094.1 Predicted arabinose efflux permease, MFS family [Desulforhopalus singaporensis]